MKISVRVGGRKETRAALRKLGARSEQATNKAARIMAMRLVEYIRENLRNGPTTGIVYKRYKPLRIHQASAPGESPAWDTGKLARSFSFEMKKLNQYSLAATIGSNLAYAAILEYGGWTRMNYIAPRRYLRPAVLRLEEEAGGILTEAWITSK